MTRHRQLFETIPPRIRGVYYDNLYDFTQVAPGKFTVRRGQNVYRIEGGKRIGGSRRDWFLEGPDLSSTPCTSIHDALRLVSES